VLVSTHDHPAIVKHRLFSVIVSQSDMLQKLTDEVRECYAHAKDCARKAAAQPEPALRQSFLDAQQCWMRLVQRLASLPELEGD
jgi:hypothetical protein